VTPADWTLTALLLWLLGAVALGLGCELSVHRLRGWSGAAHWTAGGLMLAAALAAGKAGGL
jgi:hypothetical protein